MAADLGQRKFKHRSGKTMRYVKGQATRGNMAAFTGQFAIIKEKTGAMDASQSKDFDKIVQDGGLESNLENENWWDEPVIYSLNKRKRWLLPAMIAEGIADKEFHKDCDYKVVMVEREIPCYRDHQDTPCIRDRQVLKTNKASCKVVHRSQGEGNNCRRAKKNCSYEQDLVRNPKTVRNRREEKKERRRERARTGKRIDIPSRMNRGTENVPRLPELRYEVLRPTPIHRGITHATCKPRFFEEERQSGQKKDDSEKVQWGRDLCDDDCLYFDEDEEWPLHTVDEQECRYRYDEDTPAFDLGSYIRTRQQTECGKGTHQESFKTEGDEAKQEFSRPLSSPTRKQYGKGCAIYRPDLATLEPEQESSKSDLSDLDTLDSGFESDGSSTYHNDHIDHKVTWLHLGSVAKEGVLPERLQTDFGHDYVEGCSVPRRFSIKVKAVSACGVPVSASAVFATDDVRQDPGMVNLRLRCCSADFPMQDLHQVVRERISTPPLVKTSLMDQLKESLLYHADSQEELGSKVCNPKRPEVMLDTVQSMMGWTFNCDTAERVRAQLDEEEAQQDSNATANEFSDTIPDGEDSCGICFDTLAPSGGGDEEMGTALHGCGHSFCNACWIHHVTSRVMMGETSIHCPAFKCESVLDKVTLLSLLPDSLAHIHLMHLHDNRINNHPEWKWCPNPKCGRLVQVRDKGWTEPGQDLSGPRASERLLGLPVPCECGMLWCSECKEVAHWPATCKQAEQHLQYMKETGVDNAKSESIRSVEVKRCPSCRNPMEKNGGCMHMTCNCGFCFCWECLGAWGDHKWDALVFKCPQAREGLETVLLSSKRNQSISFTELAVENRKMRHHQTVTRHHQQALSLARRMFFVPEAASHISCDGLLLQGIPSVQDLVPWSYSSNQDDQSRLTSLIAMATKMAAFAAEVRMLLEYVSTLIGQLPRKQRIQKNGWKVMTLRLMFIAHRMEQLLEGQHEGPAETVWRRLSVLLHQGKLCFRDITRTVPLLHNGPQNVKGQRSKRTVGGDHRNSGPAMM